jgi:hypothetical protein
MLASLAAKAVFVCAIPAFEIKLVLVYQAIHYTQIHTQYGLDYLLLW